MKKWIPWILVGVFALWFLSSLKPSSETNWEVADFGKLPVMANGRFQPMDSLARNSLLQLREKQAIYLPDEKRYLSATEWLMEVMMKPDVADDRRCFRIDHPDLKSLLNLPEKNPEIPGEDGKHYSWNQIKPNLEEIRKQAERINQIEASHRNPFEKAVMHLQSRTFLYMRLQNTVHPQDTKDFKSELAEYQQSIKPGMAAFNAKQANQPYDEALFEKFAGFVTRYNMMVRFDPPLLVPPHHPEESRDDWMRIGEALIEVLHGNKMHYAVQAYADMASSFRQNNTNDFNLAVVGYQKQLAGDFTSELSKARWEYSFNQMQVFYKSLVIYVVAFLLACASWFNMSEWMRRSAYYLIVLSFVIHTVGLLFRMILEGRPPVTNLYSSAIFIGWGAVVLGMILEHFYKDGIGSVVASMVGFITLIIAHNLSLGGDTMEMMRAVLDTNFWLATHVVVVTLGYASTFVAGFLAIVYLMRGFFTRTLSERTAKALTRMVYGIICFATLFSFVGTVLGGIWADQSWGRFWGWDPKENGALIIVLWNALILHARWGGMIRERGLMNMAIIGNIVTSWSWFGVNMLGIGLHSYGFMDSAFWWLMIFIASQLLLIGIGLLPQQLWLSFKSVAKRAPGALPEPQPSGK